MAWFVVETFVPEGDRERFVADVRSIQSAARAARSEDGRVRHLRSYLVPADAMGFHVIQAGSAADVTRLTELARVEVERIVPTFSVGPDGSERQAGISTVED
jgi:hypothetical protein